MQNKKFLAFCIFILLFLNILEFGLIQAQEAPPGLPSGLEDPEKLIEQAKNKTQTSWDYLGKEWKTILLKNAFVSKADSFFTKISIVFLILFGMPYSLSITLLGIIILWIFFFLVIGNFVSKKWLKGWRGYGISFAAMIAISQTGLLNKIAEFLGWLIFMKKNTTWNIAITGIIILGFILMYYLSKMLAKGLEEKEKKNLEEKSEQAKKEIIKFEEARKEGERITES